MDYLLLTGCTGLLGRYLLRDLLDADLRVAVLVRPDKLDDAWQRVESVMAHWEQASGRALARPVVICGDLASPQLGLDAAQQSWLRRRCSAVLHCAASMTFREDKRGEPFRTNVDGTTELLRVCRAAGIEQVHYVSTAFLCGLREGRVLESEQDVGQTLGNVYERSKLTAEQMVTRSDFLRQVTVYRPATVVGDSQTGYVTSYHGFYLPLQLAYIMADKIPVEAMDQRFFSRLGLNGEERKNLVPVDWLSQAICYLVTHPEHHGRTYHLASAAPVKVQTIQQVIREAIERYSNRLPAAPLSEAELQALEEQFCQYMSIYRSHWRDDPLFDLSNTQQALSHLPCPELTRETLLRIARYPIEHGFAARRGQSPSPRVDLVDRLRQWPSPPPASLQPDGGERQIGLQVNGAGGGQWVLQLDAGQVAFAEPGLPRGLAPRIYLNTSTLRLLDDGQLSIEQSLSTGKVVIEDSAQPLDDVNTVLRPLTATT